MRKHGAIFTCFWLRMMRSARQVESRIHALALQRARHRRDDTGRPLLLPNGFLEQIDQAGDKDADTLRGALGELLMAEVLAVVARMAARRPVGGDEQRCIGDAELRAQLARADRGGTRVAVNATERGVGRRRRAASPWPRGAW